MEEFDFQFVTLEDLPVLNLALPGVKGVNLQNLRRVLASCFPKRPHPMIPTKRGSLLGASCKSFED